MASSPGTDKGEEQINDDEVHIDWKIEGPKIEETYVEGPTLDSLSLKIDDCGIAVDNFAQSKEEGCETKLPHSYLKDADISDSQGYIGDSLPYISVSKSKSETDGVYQHDIEVMEASSSEKIHNEKFEKKEENEKHCERDEVMNIDKDELLTLETNSPVSLSSTPVSINHTGSPGAKRVTTDDDDESPKPKRQTPERSRDEEENVNNVKSAGGTDTTSLDQVSKDLPDLSSDSDDDDDDVVSAAANRRRLLRRRHLRHRLFGRLRASSDDSDTTTEDDDNNEDMKNTDEDEEKESDEEVQKAILEILGKPPPKPNWFAVSELRKREYGYTSHESSSCFRLVPPQAFMILIM